MVHWPGDPAIKIERVKAIADGEAANVSDLHMGAHTGTHMDAPVHFLEGAEGIDALPLEATIGPARVIAVEDPVAARAEELARHQPRRGERVLLRTRNSDRRWSDEPFQEDFVYIAADGARLLAECGVGTVGVDYLSVGGFEHDSVETHRALLEAGLWIIEGLDLSGVTAGDYEFICLPLKIVGSDGAPARALLRRRAAAGRKEGRRSRGSEAGAGDRRPREDGSESGRARARARDRRGRKGAPRRAEGAD